MGKSITPKYRVECRDQGGWQRACWRGLPTEHRLEQWRQAMNETFQPLGTNWQVSVGLGYVPHISHAKIVRQKDARVVATTAMPMFEVV